MSLTGFPCRRSASALKRDKKFNSAVLSPAQGAVDLPLLAEHRKHACLAIVFDGCGC
jgi:hypothetical protein